MPIRSVCLVLAVEAIFMSSAHAETFEYIAYKAPPGWSVERNASGRGYARKDGAGSGALLLFASRPATGQPAALFAEDWRAHVTPLVSAPAPQPTIQTQGELTAVIGASQATMEGQTVAVTFVTVIGRGRALSILGVANTKEILTQIGAFFDS